MRTFQNLHVQILLWSQVLESHMAFLSTQVLSLISVESQTILCYVTYIFYIHGLFVGEWGFKQIPVYCFEYMYCNFEFTNWLA